MIQRRKLRVKLPRSNWIAPSKISLTECLPTMRWTNLTSFTDKVKCSPLVTRIHQNTGSKRWPTWTLARCISSTTKLWLLDHPQEFSFLRSLKMKIRDRETGPCTAPYLSVDLSTISKVTQKSRLQQTNKFTFIKSTRRHLSQTWTTWCTTSCTVTRWCLAVTSRTA